MKLATIALIALSLTVLSSCSTCKPKTEYVDRIVYQSPVYSKPDLAEYPTVQLYLWGDYAVYKAQCEAQIDKCNSDMQSVLKALEE